MQQETNVATQRTEVSDAVNRGQLVQDLIGGTVTMQAAGKRYIPKGAAESEQVWQARVSATVLLNLFKRTVNYLSGQVFSRDVVLSAGEEREVPEVFDAMAADVDLQGNNLSVWARQFFDAALSSGGGLLLVDFPHVETRESNGKTEYRDAAGQWRTKTAQADAENGWRPYFVAIPQADILGWRFSVANGKRVMTQLRFFEHVVEHDGTWDTDDRNITQVRVLEPGKWQVWRKVSDDRDEWALHAQGKTSLDVIPVAPLLLGERLGALCAAPTLEDLAHLNRRHWQATADQYDLLSWMRRPVWLGVNLRDETVQSAQMSWGAGELIHSNSPDASLQSVSVAPEAVAKGQEELDKLEQQMSMFGMRLLMPRTGNSTATQNALESSENDSTLKAWAMALKDCLEQGFHFAAMWLDMQDRAPFVSVNTEFHILDGMDPADIRDAVAAGLISRRMAFDEFKRRGLLPDDADWVEALAEMENEARQGQGPNLGADLAGRLLGA